MAKNKKKKGKNKAQQYMVCPANLAEGMMAGAGKKPGKNSAWAKMLPKKASHQFLVGALLGAAATYVLGNEQMREKIIRSAVKLYGDVAGGMAELKEQVADMQAEMAASMTGDEQ